MCHDTSPAEPSGLKPVSDALLRLCVGTHFARRMIVTPDKAKRPVGFI
ncbi:Unknown protein sequence [Pseudomonas coronafaciens pv. oryzae]|nr:Unknown protein sequence [Pseudomonas coronafaciens pv. oryzae]